MKYNKIEIFLYQISKNKSNGFKSKFIESYKHLRIEIIELYIRNYSQLPEYNIRSDTRLTCKLVCSFFIPADTTWNRIW